MNRPDPLHIRNIRLGGDAPSLAVEAKIVKAEYKAKEEKRLQELIDSLESFNGELCRDIRAILELKEDWDSYGSASIDPRAVKAALRWLGGVRIVPTPKGGVQIEWHEDGWDIELEFNNRGDLEGVLAEGEEN